ncbi:MAG: hypothetical protein K8T91_08595 [Planctomycetes bacterium]|nr:hypothetical protein [Planctomycetota bacterium]
MAITSVKLVGQSSTSKRESGGARTAEETYLVKADAALSTVAAETASAGGVSIPAIGAGHTDDPERKVTNVSAEHKDGHPMICEVKVEYSTAEANADGSDKQENPLDRPPDIDWGGSDVTESYFRDTADNPVVTSAGEPFENFLERERGERILTVTRNEAALDINLLEDYKHAVNSDQFVIDGVPIPAGMAKMGTATAKRSRENETDYYAITYPIKLNKAGWKHKVDDRGFNEKDGDTLKEIVKGTPPVKVDKPWPLNGSGGACATADALPYVLTFEPYFEKPFSVFAFS